MSTTISAPGYLPGPLLPTPLWRLSVEQYHDMIAKGILDGGDPVELLEGLLVQKMPKKPRHSFINQKLKDYFTLVLPSGFFANAQEPVTTSDSEPEPDISIIRGTRESFRDRHPQAEEIVAVIEVSDTTLQRDRGIKKRLYARANIPQYWIVNLPERQVEVYLDPDPNLTDPDFRQRRDYHVGDELSLLCEGKELLRWAVGDFLP